MGEDEHGRGTKATAFTTPSRLSSYGVLAVVVVGLFLAGLAIPFVVGDPVPTGGLQTSASLPGGVPGASGGSGQPVATTLGSAPATGGSAASPTGGGVAGGATAPSTGSGGGDVAPGATAPGGGPAPAGGPLTASDRGVTEATIRVGFTVVDLGPARQAGEAINFASPETQQGWWQAAVDEVNNAGGINGRQIEPVYQSVNVLDSAQAQAACVALTEDEQVFAVVGVLYFPVADECVVNGHDTPLSTIGPNDDATYASGRLVTLMPRTSRVIAQFGGDLNAQGMLVGRNVGILGDAGSDPRGDAMRQLEELVQAGNPASVRTATLGTDLASAAAQTGLVVNNWRSAGVDTVIFIVNPSYGLAFVQNADRQFWKPAYLASDFANMGNNDVATVGMSEGYDGALAITTTSVGRDPNAALNACLDVLARNGHPVEDPEQSGLAGQQCDMFNAFLAGARQAGADLTRDTFAQGIQSAGSVDMWRVGGGAWGPGKFDLADLVTTVRWSYDCGCYEPQTEFRQGTA